MDGIDNNTFTGQQAFDAYLGTMQDVGQMISAIANVFGLDGEDAVHPSLQAFFDFTAVGVSLESQNIQDVLESAKEAKISEAEQKKKDDVADAVREGGQETMNDNRERRLSEMQRQQQFGSFDFTHGDFEDALDEIIDNNKAWAQKNGYTEEEADEIMKEAMLLKTMTPEEREERQEWLQKHKPDVAEAIENQSEEVNSNRELKNDVSISEASHSVNEEFAQMKAAHRVNESEVLSKKPSVITNNFSEEVAGIGANAQSFVLDEKPDTTPMIKEPEPFILDV